MNTNEVMDNYDKYVMHTYGRQPIVLDHGHGVKVYDKDGNEYLDFFAGIAVNNVGQTNEKVVEAIKTQAEKMIHSSNIYYNEPAAVLAEKLANKSHFTKTFFSNSGAEANEAAIKLARKATGKGEIITALKSFHGRTMLTVTATGQDQFSAPFKPLPSGFKHVPYNDLKAMEDAISDDTAAIMLEVVQGEGGVNVASQEYMDGIQKLCNDNNILLIIDEVQTGVGRCGSFFAHDLFGIKPDIVSLAKGLGGGVPIGATLATEEVASAFVPGDHGSTFGGNPLATAAADAVLDFMDEENLSENAKKMGEYLKDKLNTLKDKYDFVSDVRGLGLLVGIELTMEGGDIVDKMREKGVLINCTAGNVLRIAPALIISKEDIDSMIEKLDEVFSEI
ncbi:aspartate aminotransferase family protein [Methanobrevibacter sp. 87.7]|uniref:acetylornithine transaminase n=1 Tax=Methanobrevibacter sp. 87.7 TaxID=387957 RepID=UPI000B50004E|nr:acetylornithine transaminase [Methanobrevibacter sp. 87.7]OWT32944.1 aspartate aminotransferase family protein [Methanobrevibacter sp. 87.7]